MSTHRLPEDRCPSCDKLLDAATNVAREGLPSDGDLSVCAGCLSVLTWKSGKLLLVPIAEWQSSPEAPDLRKAILMVQTVNASRFR
jgi:hypothetical protein